MERDSTFIDLSPILNDDQNNKKGLWQKLKCKCHIPIFVKKIVYNFRVLQSMESKM